MAARDRLQKAQKDLIIEALHAIQDKFSPDGPPVTFESTKEWISMWCMGEPVLSFRWSKVNGGWTAWFPTPVFTHDDLGIALDTMVNQNARAGVLREAWYAYLKSKSDKRWRAYQGAVATMQLGEFL